MRKEYEIFCLKSSVVKSVEGRRSCEHTLCPGGPWGPATPGGPVIPWNQQSFDLMAITWDKYKSIFIIIFLTDRCSGFPTLSRRPLQKHKSSMRRWKQVLWWRFLQQSRSYHWSHFAFSRRPPLPGRTQVSSRSWWTLREQQHRCHHADPQGVIQRKSASDAEVFLAWPSNQGGFLSVPEV